MTARQFLRIRTQRSSLQSFRLALPNPGAEPDNVGFLEAAELISTADMRREAVVHNLQCARALNACALGRSHSTCAPHSVSVLRSGEVSSVTGGLLRGFLLAMMAF